MAKNNLPLYIARRTNKKESLDELDKKVYEQVKAMVGMDKGLISTIDTTHSGYVNGNNRFYTDESFAKRANTFFKPSFKPVLMNHDSMGSPVGRTMAAEFSALKVKHPDGQFSSGIIKTGIWVPSTKGTDEHIDQIKSNNYLTVSVGFNSATAKCSICGQDHLSTVPLKEDVEECRHWPGDVYNGKMCHLIVDVKNFNEQSFVNKPADQQAIIKAYATNGEDFTSNYLDFYKQNWMDEEVNSTDSQRYTLIDINYGTDRKAFPENPLSETKEMTDEVAKTLTASVDNLNANITKLLEGLKPATTDAGNKPGATDTQPDFDKKITDAIDELKKTIPVKKDVEDLATAIKTISDAIAKISTVETEKKEPGKEPEKTDTTETNTGKPASEPKPVSGTTTQPGTDSEKKPDIVIPTNKKANKVVNKYLS